MVTAGSKRTHRRWTLVLVASIFACVLATSASAHRSEFTPGKWPSHTVLIGYSSEQALETALRGREARIVVGACRRLRTVAVRPSGDAASFAADVAGATRDRLRAAPGSRGAHSSSRRSTPAAVPGGCLPVAVRPHRRRPRAPSAFVRAAGRGSGSAIVDSGADLSAPDIEGKRPMTYNAIDNSRDVKRHRRSRHLRRLARRRLFLERRRDGRDRRRGAADHDQGELGRDVHRLRAGRRDRVRGRQRREDRQPQPRRAEVRRGRRCARSSTRSRRTCSSSPPPATEALRGKSRSSTPQRSSSRVELERRRRLRALGRCVDDHRRARRRSPTTARTSRSPLRAKSVFGAISKDSSPKHCPRVALPGSAKGLYGYSSGTSFAAPQVAGAAALVWAANSSLSCAPGRRHPQADRVRGAASGTRSSGSA